jgi:PhnB protein
MAIEGGRPNERRIHPNLIVRDATSAVAWYKRAFGAHEIYRSELPDDKIFHAQLRIFDSVVLITDEAIGADAEATIATATTSLQTRSPQTLGGTTTILELYVDDVDAAFRRALEAGATVKLPVELSFFGDRYGLLIDPFGHVWSLATVVELLTPAEVERRLREQLGAVV